MSIFIKPEIPDSPNIILVGERPGREKAKEGRPFVGPAGKLLRTIIAKTGARPIILNAVNTYAEEKPTTDEINVERDNILVPLFNKYSNLPIVALGAYAAQAVYKGKRGEGSMAGQALWLHGRPVLFTYHPSYWFYTKPFPKDDRILEHIEIHIAAALRPEYKPKYIEGRLPKDVSQIVIDVETDSTDYPWYGSQLRLVGIQPLGFLPYSIRVESLTNEDIQRLNRETTLVVGHDLRYDLVHLAYIGITFDRASFHDTLIYDRYVHGGELAHDLKFLAKKRLSFPAYEAKAEQWWEDGYATKAMPPEIINPYNAGDLYAAEGLYSLQKKKLPLFDMDMDYLRVAVEMTMNGLYFSLRKMQMIGKEVLNDKNSLEKRFKRIAGVGADFNPRSPKQLRSLFARQGIPVRDTREDTIIAIRDKHPMIQVLLDYKKEEKFYNTGVQGLIKRIDESGLIHSSFGVTET
jgi:uracil-DNA glycosylase family 4